MSDYMAWINPPSQPISTTSTFNELEEGVHNEAEHKINGSDDLLSSVEEKFESDEGESHDIFPTIHKYLFNFIIILVLFF